MAGERTRALAVGGAMLTALGTLTVGIIAGEVVGTPSDVGLGTVLEERPYKNCSALPEERLWLNLVTARSLKPMTLSQGGVTDELGWSLTHYFSVSFFINLLICLEFKLLPLHGERRFLFFCFKQPLKIP